MCLCMLETERKDMFVDVVNCSMAASTWPECTTVSISRSKLAKWFCKIALRFGNFTAAVSALCVSLWDECVLNLCSAGTESQEMVVKVVSHSPFVGQHSQLVSNFNDASVLLTALLTALMPPELQKHRGLVHVKLLNANYPNMPPCEWSLCVKNEKWNHTEIQKPNTIIAHSCGFPSVCPGLSPERAKCSRQQGQRGEAGLSTADSSPQTCLPFPLESQVQPLQRGRQERQSPSHQPHCQEHSGAGGRVVRH